MSRSDFGRRPDVHPALMAISIEHDRNTPFMEALVAACAIMAFADGEIATAERRRFRTVCRCEPQLAAFSFEELEEEFATHAATMFVDPEAGFEIAYDKLEPIRDRGLHASMIVNACRLMIPADGVVHPAELRALKKIRTALGFEPEDSSASTQVTVREAALSWPSITI